MTIGRVKTLTEKRDKPLFDRFLAKSSTIVNFFEIRCYGFVAPE